MVERRVGHVRDGLVGVYVGRPTIWGNPFVLEAERDRADVVLAYADWLKQRPDLIRRARRELRGKRLLCWCYPKLCHADVLDAFANSGKETHVEPKALEPISECCMDCGAMTMAGARFAQFDPNEGHVVGFRCGWDCANSGEGGE